MKKQFLAIAIILLLPGLLYADSLIFNLSPTTAITFQNEGSTLSVDQTTLFESVDDVWAPNAPQGQVKFDYYNNGISTSYWDAIALNFDLSFLDKNNITSTTLRFYAEKGSYSKTTWEHYYVLPGAFNDDQQNTILPNSFAIDVNGTPMFTEGWVEADIPVDWIALNDLGLNELGLTLRLWNLRIDAIELKVVDPPPQNPVPEPNVLLLFVFGLGGMVAFKRKFNG